MADSKITQLNENTTPAAADLLLIVDDPSGSPETQKITLLNLLGMGFAGTPLNIGSPIELTISSGAVTITQSWHTIDTEGDAASDDLDTINGGSEGDLLIISRNAVGRDVVAKDGTGNLRLAGDFTIDSNADLLLLLYRSSVWTEISRSSN